jgi:hypothetical protein
VNNDTKVTLDLLPDGPEKQLLLLEDEVLKLTIAMADEGPSERGSSPPAAEERCLLLLGKLQRLTAKYEGAASSKVAKNKSSIRSDKGSKVAPDLTSDGPKMVLLENEVRKLTAITAAGASSTGTGSLSSEERDLLLMDALQKLTAKLEHAMGINLPDCPSDNKVAVDLLPDGPERQILLLELEVEKLIASSTAGSTTSEKKCLVLMQEFQKLTAELESAMPDTATNGSGNTRNANNQLLPDGPEKQITLLENEILKLNAATAVDAAVDATTAEAFHSKGSTLSTEERGLLLMDTLQKLTVELEHAAGSETTNGRRSNRSTNNSKIALDLLSEGPEKQMLLLEDEVEKLATAARSSSAKGASSAEGRCQAMLSKLQMLTTALERTTPAIAPSDRGNSRIANSDKLLADGPEKQVVLLENEVRKLFATASTETSYPPEPPSFATMSTLSHEERGLLLMDKLQMMTGDLKHAAGDTNDGRHSKSNTALDLLSEGPEKQMLLLKDEVQKLVAATVAGASSAKGGTSSAKERCLVLMGKLQKMLAELEHALPAKVTIDNGKPLSDGPEKKLLLLEGEVRKLATTAIAEPSFSGGLISIEKRRKFVTDELDKLTANITDTTSSIANFTDQ